MQDIVGRLVNRTKKQEALVFALIENGGNVRQACITAKTTEATAWKWLKKDGLDADVKSVRQQLLETYLENLQATTGKAVACIEAIIDDNECPQNVKLNASRAILDNALRLREQAEIINRLDEIEAKLKEEQ